MPPGLATVTRVSRDIESWFSDQQRRTQQRDDACRQKQWFATEAEARAHALMQRAQFGERRRPYQCPICDGWHLSSE